MADMALHLDDEEVTLTAKALIAGMCPLYSVTITCGDQRVLNIYCRTVDQVRVFVPGYEP